MNKDSDPDRHMEAKTIRCSVSFPADQYVELAKIAKAKKVSLAWVVREAADQYLSNQWNSLNEVK